MPFATGQEFSITQVGPDLWKLDTEIAYYDSKYVGDLIIPKDFICDGSSIPQIVWSLVGHPLQGPNGIVGFLHDYLYRMLYDREKADQTFLEAHIDLGTPFWKRSIYYWAVRTFGWIVYGRYAKKASQISETH